jgi:hypothetical protein
MADVEQITETGRAAGAEPTAPGWFTVASLQLREFSRRRVALGLLIALPMAWYVAERAAGVPYAAGAGVIGIAWSAGAASLFAVVGTRRLDQRLVQAGYQPVDLVVGRLAALACVSLVIAALFGAVILAASRPAHPGDFILALLLTALVSTALGLAAGALFPRELEGTLLLVGIVGIQVSVPGGGPYLPLYSILVLTHSGGLTGSPALLTLHALAYTTVLTVIALVVWRRHARIHA